MRLHRDWEAASALQGAWAEWDIQRQRNGWIAYPLNGTGPCVTARTPLELGEQIAAAWSAR